MIDAADFLEFSAAKLEQYLAKIEECVGKLDDEQIWNRGGEHENSIGNLCLHLSGNVRQWIVAGVGGAKDLRERSSEFAAWGGASSPELLGNLSATVRETAEIIRSLSAERLAERLTVQEYSVTALQAVYHVVEHFAYHAGQIAFMTKAMSGQDLGWYRHLERAGHSERVP